MKILPFFQKQDLYEAKLEHAQMWCFGNRIHQIKNEVTMFLFIGCMEY